MRQSDSLMLVGGKKRCAATDLQEGQYGLIQLLTLWNRRKCSLPKEWRPLFLFFRMDPWLTFLPNGDGFIPPLL